MTTFDEREKAFEKKFEHDQDLQFKTTARKNKLLGLWAAGLMGKSGADAEAYAKEIVVADLDRPGDSDVIEKLARTSPPPASRWKSTPSAARPSACWPRPRRRSWRRTRSLGRPAAAGRLMVFRFLAQ